MIDRTVWESFRSGFHEIRKLLALAQGASKSVDSATGLSEEQTFVRVAVVLLCANLESFLVNASESIADAMSGDINNQCVAIQRYVSLQSRNLISSVLSSQVNQLTDRKERGKLRETIKLVAEWHDDTALLSGSKMRIRLEGFYRQNGAKAIKKFLSELRHDGECFFDWASNRNFDKSKVWTTIEGVISARNSIAHGDRGCSLTAYDFRSYLATITRFARLTMQFIESGPASNLGAVA